MTPADAERAVKEIEAETGLPSADPIRHGVAKLVKAAEMALSLRRPVLRNGSFMKKNGKRLAREMAR